MSSEKDATEFLKNAVAALDQNNIEEFVYNRRQHFEVKPADPVYMPDTEQRHNSKVALKEISDKFWQDNELQNTLENFHSGPYPELEKWHSNLKQVASHKDEILALIKKYPKTPKAVIKFHQQYYTSRETDALILYKKFKLKADSSKEIAKWHNTLCHEFKAIIPETYGIHQQDLIHKGPGLKEKLFNRSDDSSGNGYLIFVLIWVIFKFIQYLGQP